VSAAASTNTKMGGHLNSGLALLPNFTPPIPLDRLRPANAPEILREG